eukprot:jgi/Psemu1/60203/gm1.60203_g
MPNPSSNPIAHQTRSSISLRDLSIFQAADNSTRRSLFLETSTTTSPSSTSTGESETREDETTRSAIDLPSFDESMRKVLLSIFRIKDEIDKQLCKSLIQGRLYKWPVFLDALLKYGLAQDLTYPDGSSGVQAILPRSTQRPLEALADFVGDLQEKELDWQNSELYTYDALEQQSNQPTRERTALKMEQQTKQNGMTKWNNRTEQQ